MYNGITKKGVWPVGSTENGVSKVHHLPVSLVTVIYYVTIMFFLSSLSRRVLDGVTRFHRLPSTQHHVPTALLPLSLFTRGRGQLAPKQVKHAKRQKGRVPIPIGGSTKGTTLAYGEWGIRIKGNGARLSAKQLSTAEEVIIKKLKILKGSKVYLRVFPDIPVCIKVSLLLTCPKGCSCKF